MDNSEIKELSAFLETALDESGLSIDILVVSAPTIKDENKKHKELDLVIVSSDFRDKSIAERNLLTTRSEIRTQRKYGIAFDVLNLTPEEYSATNFMQSSMF